MFRCVCVVCVRREESRLLIAVHGSKCRQVLKAVKRSHFTDKHTLLSSLRPSFDVIYRLLGATNQSPPVWGIPYNLPPNKCKKKRKSSDLLWRLQRSLAHAVLQVWMDGKLNKSWCGAIKHAASFSDRRRKEIENTVNAPSWLTCSGNQNTELLKTLLQVSGGVFI